MTTLSSIQKQLLDVDEILARLADLSLQSPKPSVFAQIRSLEKEQRKLRSEFDLEAQREETDVCKYAIDYPSRPTISGMAEAWGEFQRAFGELYTLLKQGPPKKKKGKVEERAPIDVPQFAWGYEFGGSLGVAMTLPGQDRQLFGDPALGDALHRMFQIARAQNDQDVSMMSREFGPEAMSAVYRWADIHVRNGYGVKIDWASRSGIAESLNLKPSDVTSLRDRLAKTSIESRIERNGSLIAVNLDTRECLFRMDDGEDIEATFDTAITDEHKASLPARYAVSLLERRPIVGREGKDAEPSYLLLKLTVLGE